MNIKSYFSTLSSLISLKELIITLIALFLGYQLLIKEHEESIFYSARYKNKGIEAAKVSTTDLDVVQEIYESCKAPLKNNADSKNSLHSF